MCHALSYALFTNKYHTFSVTVLNRSGQSVDIGFRGNIEKIHREPKLLRNIEETNLLNRFGK